MKYYLIVGEASGDLHASNLMKELKIADKNSEFRYLGGDLMQKQGGKLVKHFKETAYMGFSDVIFNIRKIFKSIKYIKNDIFSYQPDVLILVDYPGFNLRIAEFAHKKGLTVYYYISPKIWAWKQSRVHKIKKYIDKLFIIFPFEKEFYKQFNYEVEYLGNPIMDAIETKEKNFKSFINKYNLEDKKIIALLPGSRKSEIKHNLPTMLELVNHFSDYQFVIAAALSLDKDIFKQYITSENIAFVYDDTYELLRHSEAAIVTSGTATLETAILNIPELVCYKTDKLTYSIGKRLVDIEFISLVNLVMNKEVIKEFIQQDMNAENLINELNRIFENKEYKNKMLANFEEMRQKLGGRGASKRTAEIIFRSLT